MNNIIYSATLTAVGLRLSLVLVKRLVLSNCMQLVKYHGCVSEFMMVTDLICWQNQKIFILNWEIHTFVVK